MSGTAGPLPDRPMTELSGIVETGLDAAAQTLFSAPDTRLASTDEMLSAIAGPAVRCVLEMRIEQIVRQGHTAENDDLLPIGWLPMEARQRFERIKTAMLEEPRDLASIHALLVEGTALGLAAIDRLDRAMKRGES